VNGLSPFQVARFFIESGARDGQAVTPMKLMKLVYIAHCWSLALLDKPLISEPIRAWKYGPVIESLYHGFKRFGNSPIPLAEAESLPELDCDENTLMLLEKVWEKYGGLSGIHLSSLTHLPGSPWYKVWEEDGGKNMRYAIIPDDKIKGFYTEKIAAPSGSGRGH